MSMKILKTEIEAAAQAELDRANVSFPLFNSKHEGYAVIMEEVEEAQEAMESVTSAMAVMWDEVRGKEVAYFLKENIKPTQIYKDAINAACEMVQVAAMLLKYDMSLGDQEESGENDNE